jgi:hypothetical protein
MKITSHTLDKISTTSSSWVGLFWVKEDLSDFALHYADKEVTDADLTKGEDFFPDVTHRGSWPKVKKEIPNSESLKFNSLPRGRVEYSGKDRCFVIKTGNWLTDSIRSKIINRYNLRGKQVRFDRNPFWDSR